MEQVRAAGAAERAAAEAQCCRRGCWCCSASNGQWRSLACAGGRDDNFLHTNLACCMCSNGNHTHTHTHTHTRHAHIHARVHTRTCTPIHTCAYTLTYFAGWGGWGGGVAYIAGEEDAAAGARSSPPSAMGSKKGLVMGSSTGMSAFRPGLVVSPCVPMCVVAQQSQGRW